ncbi:MAG: hypothetical protein KBF88_14525 [Polyangiaceae bacterium]|nr:hypothetical protein [Polyangiaceae bacterium]
MATQTASKAPPAKDPTAHEEEWSAGKLVVIGLITLSIAFAILHTVSGTDCIPGFC